MDASEPQGSVTGQIRSGASERDDWGRWLLPGSTGYKEAVCVPKTWSALIR
jgi:hypothetical protein